MLYLKNFKTDKSRIEYDSSTTEKHVSYSLESDGTFIRTHKQYLTFEILSDGIIYFSGTSNNSGVTNQIQYSFDGGETWSEPSQIVTLDVHEGDEIRWKGHMKPAKEGWSDADDGEYSGIGSFHGSTAKFNVKYDIMSLIYGDDFEINDELVLTTTFGHLFIETNVVYANQLTLKSNNLTNFCYFRMFRDCHELVDMPYLLAKNLADYCYFEMFNGCSKLTKTTALIAQTLKTSCYHRMFGDCENLEQAPALLAKTLATSCYEDMFGRCFSLKYPPKLESTELAKCCYDHMFDECTSLLKAPDLPGTTIPVSAYTHMFRMCISLTESPKLKATTISQRGYRYLFSGCTNLNYIYSLHTTTPNDNNSTNQITQGWVGNVAPNGIFVQNINATWGVSGTNYSVGSGLPSGWTVIYYDTALDKYYTNKQRTQECDDHGNPVN